MSKKVRYTASDPLYDEENDILINLLHTVDHDIQEEAEVKALLNAYKTLFNRYSDEHCFTAQDIQYLHKVFLGDILSWSGQYRMMMAVYNRFDYMADRKTGLNRWTDRITVIMLLPINSNPKS